MTRRLKRQRLQASTPLSLTSYTPSDCVIILIDFPTSRNNNKLRVTEKLLSVTEKIIFTPLLNPVATDILIALLFNIIFFSDAAH